MPYIVKDNIILPRDFSGTRWWHADKADASSADLYGFF